MIKKTFGLIELSIAILIMAILFMMMFVLVVKYQKTSRNTVRTSDIKTILNSLEGYYISKADYPLPGKNFAIMDSSGALGIIAHQGLFDDSLKKTGLSIDKIPLDPFSKEYYSYTRINLAKKGVEIGGFLEDESFLNFDITKKIDKNKKVYMDYHYNDEDFGIFKLPYMTLFCSGSYLSSKNFGDRGVANINIRYRNVVSITGTSLLNISTGTIEILSDGSY